MLVVCVGRVAAVVCWLRPKGSDPCVLKVWHCNSTVDSVVSTMLCGIELYPFVLRVVQHVVAISAPITYQCGWTVCCGTYLNMLGIQ